MWTAHEKPWSYIAYIILYEGAGFTVDMLIRECTQIYEDRLNKPVLHYPNDEKIVEQNFQNVIHSVYAYGAVRECRDTKHQRKS